MEDRTQLLLLPTTVELLSDTRIIKNQIKTITHVANPGLGVEMKVITPVLQGVTTAIPMMHGISSTPSVMDALQMKPIDSPHSSRI